MVNLLFLRNDVYKETSQWSGPLIGLFFYILFFLLGYVTGYSILNIVGASFFLITFTFSFLINKRKIILEKSTKISILVICSFFISLLINYKNTDLVDLIKQVSFFLIYILLFSFKLKPIVNVKARFFCFSFVFLLIVVSIASGQYLHIAGLHRLYGIFVNPNNFSLILLTLLFFVNINKEQKYFLILTNIFIFIFLLISGTSGAIIAYMIALFYLLYQTNNKNYLVILLIITLLFLFLTLSGVIQNPYIEKITVSITVLSNLLQEGALFKGDIPLPSILEYYGPLPLPAIWRINFWVYALKYFITGKIINIVFGYGIGSSTLLLGQLPHNELIRIIFEQGLLGISLQLSFFSNIFSRINDQYKYAVLVFFAFAFTENIIDNFIFLILFLIFISSLYKRNILYNLD